MAYVVETGDHETIWQLLVDSGFHELWTPSTLKDRMRELFLAYWSEPTEPSECLLFRYQDGSLATGAWSRLPSGLYVIHQLACMRRRCDMILRTDVRDVYREVVDSAFSHGAEYILQYAERHKSLNWKIGGSFSAGLGDPKLSKVWFTPAFRRMTDAPLPNGIVPTPSYRPASFEHGGASANLFGILNMCSLPDGPSATHASDLAAVNEAYRRLGKSHYVLFDRQDDGTHADMGFQRLPEAQGWMFHRDAKQAMFDHIDRLAATPRPQKP